MKKRPTDIMEKFTADDSAPLDLDALQIDELEDEEAADGNNFHEVIFDIFFNFSTFL